ncbi:MAG: carboxymuconolactone decarboxylase family protein [Sphingomonadaceae bacterium]
MPRIPYPDAEDLTDDVRAAIGRNPANVIRMLAGLSPGVYKGFGAFTNSLFKSSALPATLRELAIVRVGHLCGSAYEVFQHEAFARFIGMPGSQLDAIRIGDPASPEFDEAERAVLAFTDDVVRNVRASDETLAALRQHLDDALVLDLIMVIGAYMTVSRFLETTGVEIDEDAIDWQGFTNEDQD